MSWEKKNYGGERMPGESKKHAVFIGRWQPYHHGHISLIRQKLNEGIPVIVMVRDMAPDEKNPYTTEQSVNMIKKYHEFHGDDVIVMVIPDIESVNFGRGVGYEVNEFIPPNDIGMISATKIRESLKSGDDGWRSMISSVIQQDVIDGLSLPF